MKIPVLAGALVLMVSFSAQAQMAAPQESAKKQAVAAQTPAQDKTVEKQATQSAGAQVHTQSDGPKKVTPEKEADIRKLLEVSGTKAMVAQTMAATEKSIRPLMANSLPAGDYRDQLIDLFFDRFHSKVDMQHFIELAIPIYDKYWSSEEIKGLIQFYDTPLGRKSLTVLPQMAGELQEAGRNWGQEMGRESMKEVLAEHPDLAKALEDASRPGQ